MIKQFSFSYSDYLKSVESKITPGIKICEIGPSGYPSIRSGDIKKRNIDYTLIDIETIHWKNYNPEVDKYEVDLQKELPKEIVGKFDLVISQMVLEHIEDPEPFHKNIYALLKQGGSAIHLYANPQSLSAVVNNILPERVGESILRKVKNRNLDYDQKYPAFYRWCFVPGVKATDHFQNLDYTVENHTGYLGHNYFQHVPILNLMEKAYSRLIYVLRVKSISTLSLLVLKKK